MFSLLNIISMATACRRAPPTTAMVHGVGPTAVGYSGWAALAHGGW
jgi:hypothetical protein